MVGPTLDLDLDARALGAKGIGLGDDVNALVRSGWRFPDDVVAHRLQKSGNKMLQVVGIHRGEISSDLGPRILPRLLQQAHCFDRLIRRFGSSCLIERRVTTPLSIETVRLRHQLLGIRETLVRRLTLRSEDPTSAVLYQPSRLHWSDRGETDGLLPSPDPRSIRVVTGFELGEPKSILGLG